ncbi:YggT family protein [Parvularcula oceani]|uniref:YggT family protein n=1 Tax=Parvularcula oceani TaxID=1247963 RepID=UPI0004E19F66|nr:YggT family protein [Parvularcula oceani]
MAVIAYIVNALIDLYIIILIVTIIASWLVAFGIVNRNNQIVDAILRTCYGLTEPVLRPVRNMLPSMGGIDISPIFVFIGLRAIQLGLNNYVFGPAVRNGF